jgi:uncharacterized lipoprotein YbaY
MKLRGTVHCEAFKEIPDGSKVVVEVVDGSIGCGPTRIIGKAELTNKKTFPFEYEVDYDESKVNKELPFGFHVRIDIKNNGKAIFRNGGSYMIMDPSNSEFLDKVDVNVFNIEEH